MFEDTHNRPGRDEGHDDKTGEGGQAGHALCNDEYFSQTWWHPGVM